MIKHTQTEKFSVRTTININSSQIFEETSNLSIAVTNVLSWQMQDSSVHIDEEKEEMILMPKVFLVEETAPNDVPFAEIAELVEWNQTSSQPSKQGSCLFLVVNAFIVIALQPLQSTLQEAMHPLVLKHRSKRAIIKADVSWVVTPKL